VKPVEHGQAAADRHHRHEGIGHGVHVEDRQRRDHPLAILGQRAQPARPGIPAPGHQEIGVGQDAALRLAGGARGVEKRGLALTGEPSRKAIRASSRGCGKLLAGRDHRHLDACHVRRVAQILDPSGQDDRQQPVRRGRSCRSVRLP
jgi:hypothetical protein